MMNVLVGVQCELLTVQAAIYAHLAVDAYLLLELFSKKGVCVCIYDCFC